MPKRGRKALETPRIRQSIFVSTDIYAEIKLLLEDPLRGKVRYGSWTELVDGLLREWVNQQRHAHIRLERRFHERRVGVHNYFDERLNRRKEERRTSPLPETAVVEGV